MEGGVFRKDPTRSVLREHFVEARLHMDISDPLIERKLALQKSFVDSKALPVYIIIDPSKPTPAGTLARLEGGGLSNEEFKAFLQKALGS